MSFNTHRTVFVTKDGSPTFRMEEVKETYHSRHGALTESQYVFITQGLEYWQRRTRKKSCQIFEMGLGTGLNAYLTAIYGHANAMDMHYHAVEAVPLPTKEWEQLGLSKHFLGVKVDFPIAALQEAPWGKEVALSEKFQILKQTMTFEQLNVSASYDILFYDAFGAHVQPELWTESVMQKCYEMLTTGGVWVSYCAKGSVRRALAKAGFEVERLPGPPGKREMLRAVKV